MAEYEGLYCTGCEEFKQESQIVDGHCIEHPTLELVHTRERNHFFRLSRYGSQLLELITTGGLRVEPAIRRNEVLRLLESGLQDISVSRLRQPWGIPFPADPDQTVYVWFDALINYLSATGFPQPGYERLWPADLHVVGKGITRFHCVIWPAMLLAARLELPREVWAHGYVQWEGTKMSKTSGTAVTLDEAIERHGSDALRYFLLREVGFESDGNFTWERFDERYTADLADGLGNLASRSLAMLLKYRDGVVPRSAEPSTLDLAGRTALSAYVSAMDELDLRGGAEAAWSLVSAANLFVQQSAPWALAKAGKAGGAGRDPGSARAGAGATGLDDQPLHSRKGPELVGDAGSGGFGCGCFLANGGGPRGGRTHGFARRSAVPQACKRIEVKVLSRETI